ncbi:MAG TPA: tripartite tricarboxylate transporter substrate binding protein [Xanthobacteraceae bacterium]|jgi:tripartite-type tricarboxylate transporter receptor subunit TctC|nr:tripartite tricarboxylate transporter substrate binding protein [Xanthobacteraceae bacterium]
MSGLHRRQFLGVVAGVAALPTLARVAYADTYPTRPVHMLVGFAPGGGTDVMARAVQPGLSERLGQTIVIENRPGAGTNIATEAVIHATPDGYTLLAASLANAGNATLYPDLKFNFIRDTVPISGIALDPFVLQVTPSLPVKTIPELIAYAKAHPGKVLFGSGGIGSGNQLTAEMFKMMAGIDIVHVPYRGAGPAMVDLMAGQVQMMFNTMSASLGHVKGGKIRALGVATKTPQAALPGVPTVAEFVPGYEASFWTGVAGPKGTPAEVVDKVNKSVNGALADDKLKARFAEWGATALTGSPADFAKFVADETEKWGKVIRTANIKAE